VDGCNHNFLWGTLQKSNLNPSKLKPPSTHPSPPWPYCSCKTSVMCPPIKDKPELQSSLVLIAPLATASAMRLNMAILCTHHPTSASNLLLSYTLLIRPKSNTSLDVVKPAREPEFLCPLLLDNPGQVDAAISGINTHHLQTDLTKDCFLSRKVQVGKHVQYVPPPDCVSPNHRNYWLRKSMHLYLQVKDAQLQCQYQSIIVTAM
jgi:hypothetical protein